MEVELTAEANDKRLNRAVAISVVILSVFTGLGNIKDGNIVQNMAQAQSQAVDRWSEYQATKTKTHIAETARTEIAIIAAEHAGDPRATAAIATLDGEIAKYLMATPHLAAEAKGFADRYDALNVHDDQFDASEALISTAISLAAVAALVESYAVLAGSLIFGAMGMFMGVCGFAGLAFHPDILSNFLG